MSGDLWQISERIHNERIKEKLRPKKSLADVTELVQMVWICVSNDKVKED